MEHSGMRAAENVAWGYRSGPAAVRGWMGSPGHRANLLGPHTHVGFGVAGSYYTSLHSGSAAALGKPRAPGASMSRRKRIRRFRGFRGRRLP